MKIKNLAVVAVMVSILGWAMVADAQGVRPGTEVGGTLESEFDPLFDSVSDVQGDEFDEYLEHYGNRALEKLNLGQVLAGTNDRKSFAEKRDILTRALRAALRVYSRWPSHYQPMTRVAIERGRELDREAFDGSRCAERPSPQKEQCLVNENRTAYRVLFAYIEHVKRFIVPLDNTYLVPAYAYDDPCYPSTRCDRQGIWVSLYQGYQEAALNLLKFYLGEQAGLRTGFPESLFSHYYKTRVAEKVFKWVSRDLRWDDFRESLYCPISDTDNAFRLLQKWNAGIPIWGSPQEAVRFAVGTASVVRSELAHPQCSDPYSYPDWIHVEPVGRSGQYLRGDRRRRPRHVCEDRGFCTHRSHQRRGPYNR